MPPDQAQRLKEQAANLLESQEGLKHRLLLDAEAASGEELRLSRISRRVETFS